MFIAYCNWKYELFWILIFRNMMDELVQDLVSALEQTSEQSKLGELWEEMVLSPLRQRRQIRRRRGQRRYRESSLFPLKHRCCWIEASESSLDEMKEYRKTSSSTIAAAVATCSDSDDTVSNNRWHQLMRHPAGTRQPSWPESESLTENNSGRQLRRRRKVKRMISDVTVRLQPKVKVPNVDGKRRHGSSHLQHLSGVKKRSVSWVGAERQSEGARLMGKECWKRKEHRDGADENMSEGETSSTCSSDPGLFTNDEGRQGDDEQSDWFFEGDCGVGTAVNGLLSSWDSDKQLSLDGNCPSPTFLLPPRPSHRAFRHHSRLRRAPGSAACCIRKDRRQLPRKRSSVSVFVERQRSFCHDPCQRCIWRPSVAKRDLNQFFLQLKPLCRFPVCPIDTVSENAHLRCSPAVIRNSHQPISEKSEESKDSRNQIQCKPGGCWTQPTRVTVPCFCSDGQSLFPLGGAVSTMSETHKKVS
ncbi:G patch domain-containing protein 2-like isoform X3 [Takifugu rubripes]|uniref:G patch domain-containing protein 2-like isoform X3 n=1 Tax=Takifugu rubripes TaxID=31033 RepID=UPI0005D23EF2|nr:G patch domain-containing protein 2-like isoform X3 [Takifugu rubripes]|eukprot:XP_011615179.1 PREDICTED: G patch domain-containing protein 2-like isoform X2 [Takifugu rubripes]